MIRAKCDWGNGAPRDVVIYAEELGRDSGLIGLTANDARRLAAELLVAADRADELEAGVQR